MNGEVPGSSPGRGTSAPVAQMAEHFGTLLELVRPIWSCGVVETCLSVEQVSRDRVPPGPPNVRALAAKAYKLAQWQSIRFRF